MHLQADVLPRPEGAADPTEHEPHLVLGQAEAGGDLAAVLVQPLRGDVQLDAAGAGVGYGDGGLQPEERLVLHPDLVGPLDDDIPGGVGIAVPDALVAQEVAVRVDRLVGPGDRRLGVEQGVEDLVGDDDRVERPPAGLGVVGGDRRHRLADVAHHVAGEHRLVGGDQPVGRLPRHVVGRDHRLHSRDPPRRRGVDRHDAGVRVGRAQRRAPRRALDRDVRREGERALGLHDPVGAHRRVADPPRGARRRRRLGGGHSGAPAGDGHGPHGVDDPAVARAAADVARQLLADLGLRRLGMPVEEDMGGHDQSWRAEPALHRPGVDEGPLDVRRRARFGQPFDGEDRLVDGAGGEDEARADELAVDEHAARAALALLARALGSEQTEPLPEHVQEALAQPGVLHLVVGTVDVKVVQLAHLDQPPGNARRRSRRASTSTACRRYAARRPVVVDRPGRGAGEPAELLGRGIVDGERVPVDRRRGVRLGLGGPDDGRGDRPEGEADRAGGSVDGQARPGDGDHHRVADADLGVSLPAVEHGHGHRGDQLVRSPGGALDPGHELADGELPPAGRALQLDHRVEGGKDRQTIAGGRAGGQVAPDRGGVADLRGSDRAGGLGERREQGGERGDLELGVGHAGSEADGPRRRIVGPAAQLGHPVDGDDRVALGEAVTGPVDLDHQVGAAGEDQGVGMVSQGGDGRVERPGNQHAHRPELYKRPPTGIRVFAVNRVFRADTYPHETLGCAKHSDGEHDFRSPHTPWLVSAASRDGRHA